jgi:hypothetical protein
MTGEEAVQRRDGDAQADAGKLLAQFAKCDVRRAS